MKPEDLDNAINAEFDQFYGMTVEAIMAAQKKAGKAAVKAIKASAPGDKYGKEWKSKTTKTRTGAETVIYQGKRPGLAHLLEFGHPIVSGGRTVGQAKAFPHVEPAEDIAIKAYEEEFTRLVENGN